MSETEYWSGKLIKVELDEGETVFKRQLRMLSLIKDERLPTDDPEDVNEAWADEFYDEYLVIGGEMWRIEGECLDDGYGFTYTMNDDGSINFQATFYNGGTCMSEVAEDIITEAVNEAKN